MSTTTTPKANMAGMSEELRKQMVCKPRSKYIFGNRPIDLREINDEAATALANNPACMFLAWKDPKKRPEGQAGVFAPTEAELKGTTPPAATAEKK